MEGVTDTLCGRPLTFGDTEQIVAIKAMRSKAALLEGDNKRYEVTIGYSGQSKITVEAKCETEAEDKAIDMFEFDNPDLDNYDIEDVECLSEA